MEKELNLFKEFFQPFENIAILHINNGLDFITPTLDDVAQTYHGTVNTIAFKEEKDARLNAVAREYEYIVLSNILTACKHKDKILQLMYKALENSANIIILEKKSNHNEDEIKSLLDKASFVAINTTSDLFEEYHCITAKKLHMWGSGL
ncbi:MAG: hypothetical protein ACNI3C_03245 [Candidatus Marinarcus sp.]|uniref:hypothetical protein n=1 Tax=Candidatus Marinarcus sp. TaxID=3100987 RepID=UPI003AFFE177